jgi:hypothetical protein
MITTSDVRFPKFRENPDDYRQSQKEWLDVFSDALKPADQAGWDVWLQDPFLEGAPMFSRVNRAIRKGVVVNQILPSDDSLGFRAYLDIFAPDSAEDRIEHVVITTVLTDTTKKKAAALLRQYLRGQRPKQEIVATCEDLTG